MGKTNKRVLRQIRIAEETKLVESIIDENSQDITQKFPRNVEEVYFLFCEGQKTEILYFKGMTTQHTKPNIKVFPDHKGHTDPKGLLNEAQDKMLVELESIYPNFDRSELLNKLEDSHLHFGIVFDTEMEGERFKHYGELKDFIDTANKKHISVYYTTPCFEYWFLLHYCFSRAEYKKCKDIVCLLKQYWTGYKKESHDSFEHLIEKLPIACKNAEHFKGIITNLTNESPLPRHFTNVDEFVKLVIPDLIPLKKGDS